MLKLHSIKCHDCGLIIVSKKYYSDSMYQKYHIYLYDSDLKLVFHRYTNIGFHDLNEWNCDIELNTYGYWLIYGTNFARYQVDLSDTIDINKIPSIKKANIIYNDKVIIKYDDTYLLIKQLKYILYVLPIELQNEIKIILFKFSYKGVFI